MAAYEPEWQQSIQGYVANAQMNLDRPQLGASKRSPSRGGWMASPLVAWQDDLHACPSSNFDASNSSDVGRQLRGIMAELEDIRRAQRSEQEMRAATMQSLSQKIKEDMQVEFAATEMRMQKALAESETNLKQKFMDSERTLAQERQRQDVVVRNSKLQERQYRDSLEILKEDMAELRGKVDSALAAMKQNRVETTQMLEHERGVQVQRLDTELQRYEERARQRDSIVGELRTSVTREMMEVQKVAREYVRKVWEERSEALNKHVNEKLSNLKQAQDMQTGIIVDIGNKMLATRDEMKVDLAEGIRDLKVRLHKMEIEGPTLSTRMDRFDRKADILTERTNQNDQVIDALKGLTEKTQNQSAKLHERLTVSEQMIVDLETRTSKMERNCAVLQHVEVNQKAIDVLRKDVERILYSMQSMKDIVAQDEKAVEIIRQTVDTACDRVEVVEKKATKAIGRFEGCEQKVASFHDRLSAVEQHHDIFRGTLDKEQATQKEIFGLLDKHGRKAAVLAEKLDVVDNSWRQKTQTYDQKFDRMEDRQRNIEALIPNNIERNERRITMLENSANRSFDHVEQFAQTIDFIRKEVTDMDKKLLSHRERFDHTEKSIQGKQDSMDSAFNGILEKVEGADRRLASAIENSERKMLDRIEQVTGITTGVVEKSKDADRQAVVMNASLQRLEDQILSEMKDVRSRIDKNKLHGDDLVKNNEACVRSVEEKVDGLEKMFNMVNSKVTTAQSGLSALQESAPLILVQTRVDDMERSIKQLQDGNQTFKKSLQEVQDSQLKKIDVNSTVDELLKKQQISQDPELQDKLDSMNKTSKAAERKLQELREEFDASTKSNRISGSTLSQLSDSVENLDSQLKAMKERLTTAERSRNWDAPLNTVQNRVDVVEKTVQGRIDGLEKELATMVGKVRSLSMSGNYGMGPMPVSAAVAMPNQFTGGQPPAMKNVERDVDADFGRKEPLVKTNVPQSGTGDVGRRRPVSDSDFDSDGIARSRNAVKAPQNQTPSASDWSDEGPSKSVPPPKPTSQQDVTGAKGFDDSDEGTASIAKDAAKKVTGTKGFDDSDEGTASVSKDAAKNLTGTKGFDDSDESSSKDAKKGSREPDKAARETAGDGFDSQTDSADEKKKHGDGKEKAVSIAAKSGGDNFDSDEDVADILEDSDAPKAQKEAKKVEDSKPPTSEGEKAGTNFDSDEDVADILKDSDDAKVRKSKAQKLEDEKQQPLPSAAAKKAAADFDDSDDLADLLEDSDDPKAKKKESKDSKEKAGGAPDNFDSEDEDVADILGDSDDAKAQKTKKPNTPPQKTPIKSETDDDLADILEDSDEPKAQQKKKAESVAPKPSATKWDDSEDDLADILGDSDDAKKKPAPKKAPAKSDTDEDVADILGSSDDNLRKPPPKKPPPKKPPLTSDSEIERLVATSEDEKALKGRGRKSDFDDDSDLGSLDLSALSDGKSKDKTAKPAARGAAKPSAASFDSESDAPPPPAKKKPSALSFDSDSDSDGKQKSTAKPPVSAKPAGVNFDSSDTSPVKPPAPKAKAGKRAAGRFAARTFDSDSDFDDDAPPAPRVKPKSASSRKSADTSLTLSSGKSTNKTMGSDDMAAALDMFDKPSSSSRPKWK